MKTAASLRLPALLALCIGAHSAFGQDMEARAYSANPIDARFLVISYAHTDGDVLLDAAAPIEDFKIRTHGISLGLGGTFALWDRQASVGLGVPYVDGDATGRVNGVPEQVERKGFGDLRARFMLSLLPGSAMNPAEFRQKTPDRTFGVGLVVSAPTGEYLDDKLVNLGTNRWAIRPEIGGSRRLGRWNVDGSAGVWFFTDNDSFFGGHERSQEPITTLQGHVSYTFRPRLWFGLSGTWYTGGTTSLDGISDRNPQSNSRAGATLSIPVGPQDSIRLAWSQGVTARFGGDVDSLTLTWQHLWFARRPERSP